MAFYFKNGIHLLCMSNFFCTFVPDFVCAYENINSNRTCRSGDFAAECGGYLPERSYFSVATYPSKRTNETGWYSLLNRAGQRDAAQGREENKDLKEHKH